MIGDRLNFIIDHRLESVDAFHAILPIIIGTHIFTELSTFYALEGNPGLFGFHQVSVCPCVKVIIDFPYIALCKSYFISSTRLSVRDFIGKVAKCCAY